jgi:hypothetical protein
MPKRGCVFALIFINFPAAAVRLFSSISNEDPQVCSISLYSIYILGFSAVKKLAKMGTTHPSDRTHDVAVVGGSLGGLAAGIVLKDLSKNVIILERNPTKLLQNQGAGIVAGGDTLEYLKTYNRCERPIAVQSQARMYLDKSGKVVHRVEMAQSMTSWDLTYYLLRANYDGVVRTPKDIHTSFRVCFVPISSLLSSDTYLSRTYV